MASVRSARETGKAMMKIPGALGGIIVPLVTPLDDQERVDSHGLRKLVEYLLSGAVNGIFILGTTGEFPRLVDAEKKRLIATVTESAGGKIPICVGIGECGTRKSLELAGLAQRSGADFLVSTLPFYFKVMEVGEQVAFFRSILDSSDIPIILYNMPETVGAQIHIETIRQLLHHPLLVGIKDSGGEMEYFNALLEFKKARRNWKVFCGHERMAFNSLMAGADGLVPSIGNVFPRMMGSLWEAAVKGDWESVRKIQSRVDEVNRYNMKINSSLRGVIMRKKALEILGICNSKVSEPCMSPPAEILREFEAVIKENYGLYEQKA